MPGPLCLSLRDINGKKYQCGLPEALCHSSQRSIPRILGFPVSQGSLGEGAGPRLARCLSEGFAIKQLGDAGPASFLFWVLFSLLKNSRFDQVKVLGL